MDQFSIRVYGILINEQHQVLVSDEYIRGNYFTKFPGGGMELGEGTRDCLRREFLEEIHLKVEVLDHIYTTDYFQVSGFNTAHQILAIYYYVKALEPITAPIRTRPFDFDAEQLAVYEKENQTETIRFLDWEQFTPENVTLPIDKIVVEHVRKQRG